MPLTHERARLESVDGGRGGRGSFKPKCVGYTNFNNNQNVMSTLRASRCLPKGAQRVCRFRPGTGMYFFVTATREQRSYRDVSRSRVKFFFVDLSGS